MKKCLVGVLFLFFLSGCSYFNLASGPTETVTKSLPLTEDINEGVIEVHFGVGTLNFIGSTETEGFIHGQFTYNNESLVPAMDYKAKRGKGTLILKPKKSKFTGNIKNDWELSFTEEIPLSFQLKLGVGENKLHFDNLYLKDLTVEAGVGDTLIDLTKVKTTDFNVNVRSGVGSTKLVFSKDHAVVVDVSKGLGNVSANGFLVEDGLYKTTVASNDVIRVFVSQGVGEVKLVSK
jgi:hypothetical protein